MPDRGLKTYRRRLPHWRLGGSTYFVTFRLAERALTADERNVVLAHIRSGHRSYYTLVAITVMPDHVHSLIKPDRGVSLSRVLKGIKGVSARRVNTLRGTGGSLWQDESWDRIVRDESELREKLAYMVDNADRKGLAQDGWEYDGWYLAEP